MKFVEDKNFTYVINEDATGCIDGKPYKGIVVCKTQFGKVVVKNKMMEDVVKVLPKKAVKTLNIKFNPFRFEELFTNEAYKPFVGKAYCFTEDQFDEKEGMRIARKKALNKVENFRMKMLNEISALIDLYKSYFWAEGYHQREKMIKYLEEDK